MSKLFNGNMLLFYPLTVIAFWVSPLEKYTYISLILIGIAFIPFAMNFYKEPSFNNGIKSIVICIFIISICFIYGQFTGLLNSDLNVSENHIEYVLFIKSQSTMIGPFILALSGAALILLFTNSLILKIGQTLKEIGITVCLIPYICGIFSGWVIYGALI